VSTRNDPLLAAWEKSLGQNRDGPAILDARGKITRTFSGIEERAQFFAHQLKPFRPGDVVAIQIGNHPDWPSLFVACLRQQIVVLPLERSITEKERVAAMEICCASAVFASVPGGNGDEVVLLRDSDVAAAVPGGRKPDANSDAAAVVPGGRGPDVPPLNVTAPANWGQNPPALLKLTSGTTAAPRAIRFRGEQLLADSENICQTMGITRGDLNYGVIPISHSYGFSNLLTPLIARGIPMTLSSDRMPRAIIDGLVATRATVFPGMPVFYQSLCELDAVPALPELRLCISAGAPLAIEVVQAFRAQFGHEIHSFYGSSECGGICYEREPEPLAGFVGQPMKGVDVELLDLESASSRIHVRSRAVGDGYFPEPDESKLGKGVFFPDDLLQKTASGYRIVGRVSDLINVAGKKVNPAEVEAEILRYEGVRQAVAFGRHSERRNQEVAACVVARDDMSEGELLAYLRARLSSWQVPRRIYFVDAIPVTERGKTSRQDLARRFASGA
jgi:acyl-CoA synthetase (AMP-forming)/AMP-acid ligase II